MEQRSLRVVETNKTFFAKITNTISKILIPTRIGINGIMISMKRNSLLKAYQAYNLEQANEKKELLAQKYEDAYALYLEAIDKHIMDSVYKKVKNGTATEFEKDALSKYYLIISLKDKHYIEYKYKKQEYLLRIDYESVKTIKKENIVKKYSELYISKMNSLYKGLLKCYSVELADGVAINNNVYDKIFNSLETYVTEVLAINLSNLSDNKELLEEYEKYEQKTVGKLDERDKIMQKVALIGISRHIFTHSFPLVATEKCYIELMKTVRDLIVKQKNALKRDKLYRTLYEIIEEYSLKLLSTKIYWDKPEEKEEYKKFWEEYKIADDERKEILVLKYELKKLNKEEKQNKAIIKLHKEKLVKLGAMKELKDTAKTDKKYISKKIIAKCRKE